MSRRTEAKGALLSLLLSIRSSWVEEPLLKCLVASLPACWPLCPLSMHWGERRTAAKRKLTHHLLSLHCDSYFWGGCLGDRGVKAAGGARKCVLPCSRLWIGQVALTVSRKAIQKCWEKDNVVDIPLRQRVNSCRGKRKWSVPQNKKVCTV